MVFVGSLLVFGTGTTIAFFQSEGTIPVSKIFLNHLSIKVLASFPACFRNSTCIWSCPGDFLFFSCFIVAWGRKVDPPPSGAPWATFYTAK